MTERMEKICSGKMKRRHLKNIEADERVAIAKDYFESNMQMAAVASEHHISIALAGRICKDYRIGGQQTAKKRMKDESVAEAKDSLD